VTPEAIAELGHLRRARDHIDRNFAEPLDVPSMAEVAIFRADDVDATFERVRASGAEVLQEPKSQRWGARDCASRDPSGNLVRIGQA
jgi:uncharacterized glyoxalase superfamily protein PhnB